LFRSSERFLNVLTRGDYQQLDAYQPIRQSQLFKAIVSLARAQRDVRGIQAIVNLNYDDLIEEWMREPGGIRCDTLLSGQKPARDASLPCYHVHGVLPFRRLHDLKVEEGLDAEARAAALVRIRPIIGNFVFSEDEYHTEYSDPYRWSNMTMINQLGRFSGLFVGLSLQDPNLRRLIDVTHRQYPDITNYAVLTRKTPRRAARSRQATMQDLFEKVETASFADIGVKVIWTDTYDEVPARIFEICNIDKRA
jgi:SIR2-like domain